MYFLCSNSSALLQLSQSELHSPTISLSWESDGLMFTFIDFTLAQRRYFGFVSTSGILFFFLFFVCFFIFGLRVFEVALTLLKHVHFWPALPFPSSICENGLLWIRPSLTIYLNYFLFPSPSSTFLTYRFIFISWFNVYLICLIAVTNPLKFKCDRVTDFCQFS